MSDRPLTGTRVFFLGAEGPHGRRIAVALGEAGATVVLASLAPSTRAEFQLNSIANEFWAFGASAETRLADLSDANSLAGALEGAGAVDVVVTHVLHGPGAEDPRNAVTQVDTLLWRAIQSREGLLIVQVIGGDPETAGYAGAAQELLERTRRLAEDGRARACAVILDGGMPAVLAPFLPQERFETPDAGEAVRSAVTRRLDGVALYADLP